MRLKEENLYLGIAHVTRGRSSYTHFFFALEDKPPFKILGVSREWCIAHPLTLSEEAGQETLCEGVQFVGGLALLDGVGSKEDDAPPGKSNQTLAISYGVMDCDSRMVRVSVSSALKAISFHPKRAGGGAGKKEL